MKILLGDKNNNLDNSNWFSLTSSIYKGLEDGDKVEFKWHGSDYIQKGRIEVKIEGLWRTPCFVGEEYYENGSLKEFDKWLRYYNPLEKYRFFVYFKMER